jgi:spore photoproduct lyase
MRELELAADPFSRGKKILRLTRHKGIFVKPCPGTPEYVCCGLKILHVGQGCPMDCRYCALQAYFNRPVLELFVNVEDLFSDLTQYLNQSGDTFQRLCTGEFTDSLALDDLTGLAPRLAEFFASVQDASLEIKTKTDAIDPLLDIDPKGRVITAFSMNALGITRQDELRAASLQKRLDAALRAQKKGYLSAFHFDPIIPVQGWYEEYGSTINSIFHTVDSSRIAWISLGVLRFVPGLKEVAEARFGKIRYFHDGFLRGLDGKCRLHVDRRIEVYSRMAERIRKHDPNVRIYLCMESPHVWQKSLGLDMQHDRDLEDYLNSAVGKAEIC